MKAKPIYLYAPIRRVDEQERIVEGYCFVNEVVDGDPLAITRAAMEAATADYMRYGAVRSMHQPLAAGTAVSVTWDERGAVLTAKIVDDAEWKKCQEGVYKGFSIGIRPRVVRGKRCTACTWVENSLVDRPADPDAVFTLTRADDASGEIDVEIERGAFADAIANAEKRDLRYLALSLLSNCLYDIADSSDAPEVRSARAAEVCDEFKDYVTEIVARAELPEIERLEPGADIQRLQGELDGKDAELASARAELAQIQAEVKRLKATPPRPPQLSGFPIERTFLANNAAANAGRRETLEAELQEIQRGTHRTDAERQAAAIRISAIKAELAGNA